MKCALYSYISDCARQWTSTIVYIIITAWYVRNKVLVMRHEHMNYLGLIINFISTILVSKKACVFLHMVIMVWSVKVI